MRRALGSSVPASPSPRPLPSREREKINNGPGRINNRRLALLPFKSLPHHEERANQHLPLPSREREKISNGPGGINNRRLALLPFKSLPHREERANQHLPLPSREREGVRGRPQVADGVFHSFRTLPADHGPQGSLNARGSAGRARSLQEPCRPSGRRTVSSGTPEPPPPPATGRTSS
jgi:hypothetical protein